MKRVVSEREALTEHVGSQECRSEALQQQLAMERVCAAVGFWKHRRLTTSVKK